MMLVIRTPKKQTKFAWGSYWTRAAVDRVLLYLKTKDEPNV